MHGDRTCVGKSRYLHCDALAPSRCREPRVRLVVVGDDGSAETVEVGAKVAVVGSGGNTSWTDGVWVEKMRLVAGGTVGFE